MKFFDSVLYEDNHILAVDKPAGMLTQSNENEQGLEDILREDYRYLHAVHRIDAPVSGVVVFAKSSKGLSRMSASLKAGEWTKMYRAHVEGALKGSGLLEHCLVHGHHRAEISDKGKLAQLKYVALHVEATTVLDIELITGRYHQIRAQLSAIGHPIVGDKKYGSTMTPRRGGGTIDLHHYRVTLPHPTLQKFIEIDSKEQPFNELRSM